MSYMFQFISDDEKNSVSNTRGLNSTLKGKTEVASEQLKEQFDGFLKAVDSLFDVPACTGKGGLILDEIELNLSVGSEGKISILSSVAGGISANSGIKIKLKRKESMY